MSAADLEEGELAGELNENWNLQSHLEPSSHGRVRRVSDEMQGPGAEQVLEKLDRAQKRRLKKMQKKGTVALEPQTTSHAADAAPAKKRPFVDIYGTNVSRALLQLPSTIPS